MKDIQNGCFNTRDTRIFHMEKKFLFGEHKMKYIVEKIDAGRARMC